MTTEFRARFPPAKFETRKTIPNSSELAYFDTLAHHVGNYVRDHFGAVTQCATPGTDTCALAWLEEDCRQAVSAAAQPGRDGLPPALYNTLKSQS